MKLVKYISVVFIVLIISHGCEIDADNDLECPIFIHGIDFYGAKNDTLQKEFIYNWKKTQYFNEEINFAIKLDVSGDPAYCGENGFMDNPTIDSTIRIWCNKDLLYNTDTILAESNIIDFFNVYKFEDDIYKDEGYLLSFKSIYYEQINFDTLFSIFCLELNTEKGIYFRDSCIVKIKMKHE